MKRCQTTKYRKQRKKERANSKAKQEQRRRVEEPTLTPKPDAPSMSPARKAFQGL